MNESSAVTQARLCPAGIPGLDTVLGGGLPRDRVYLVEGDPGVGKTTLALQFLLEGARRKEQGLYFTLSETLSELRCVAESHGWNLDSFAVFELSAIEQQMQTESENTFFHPSEVELNKTIQVLLNEVERVKPARVVFDSLSEMRLLAETPLRFRRQMLGLKQYFAGRNCTVLFLDDRTAGARDFQVDSIAHGVISLSKTLPKYGVSRRSLNVVKVRGVKYREGFHDFVVATGGVQVFPRLIAAEHHREFDREPFPSGIEGLDALLGGGLDRGTSSVFMGPPGTGKSTLAIQFAATAAARGERADFFAFDETVETLLNRAEKLGLRARQHVKSGLLRIQQVDPAELSPGELTHRIQQSVERENGRMVVIDSINGYLNAMPAERYLNLQLHELLSYLNQQGVISILVLAQQGLIGQMQAAVDLTYLADTVLLHRFFEVPGELRQAISVIKKRSGDHERTIREFKVAPKGIEVGPPLTNFQGILTGVPRASEFGQTVPSLT